MLSTAEDGRTGGLSYNAHVPPRGGSATARNYTTPTNSTGCGSRRAAIPRLDLGPELLHEIVIDIVVLPVVLPQLAILRCSRLIFPCCSFELLQHHEPIAWASGGEGALTSNSSSSSSNSNADFGTSVATDAAGAVVGLDAGALLGLSMALLMRSISEDSSLTN